MSFNQSEFWGINRCRIGAVYDRSPAERFGMWLADNFLRVLSAAIASVIFCFAVNVIVNQLMNFLQSNSYEPGAKVFSGDSPMANLVKLAGSLVLSYFLIFRLRSRGR